MRTPEPAATRPTTNAAIADRFEEVAALLAEQGANPYRARAYRNGAATLRRLDREVAGILASGGLEALEALPGIGESLARAIRDLVVQGRLPMLDRLRGEADPVALLTTVPGIGPKLAAHLHEGLGIHTLEELEIAAHDGRLAAFPRIGPRRLASIRDTLAQRLARVRTPLAARMAEEPPVEELLDVDREYRERAAAGTLRRIAPRRFNPGHEAWLPILHTSRGPRHYIALYSNTAHAHRAGRTRDWVVLYVDGEAGERTYTVITAERGPRKGQRIVSGPEPGPAER
jgi:Holliday junction resolvasome RuvABC DNA-binding subunit